MIPIVTLLSPPRHLLTVQAANYNQAAAPGPGRTPDGGRLDRIGAAVEQAIIMICQSIFRREAFTDSEPLSVPVKLNASSSLKDRIFIQHGVHGVSCASPSSTHRSGLC